MENGRNFWDEGEAITLLDETEFLVGELTKGGVPFPDRERHYREIVRAAAARERGAYEDALAAYTGGARRALEKVRGRYSGLVGSSPPGDWIGRADDGHGGSVGQRR